MNILALCTATEACSVALLHQGTVHSLHRVVGRDHTQHLGAQVAEVMAGAGCTWAEVEGLVCGTGPGSFAGVRIATAYAKGIALALGIPAIGVSSLRTLAAEALAHASARTALVAIDARMGEVYWQAFGGDAAAPVALGEAVVCAPEHVPYPDSTAGAVVAIGSGWGAYGAPLHRACAPYWGGAEPIAILPEALPEAATALALTRIQWQAGERPDADALSPLYVRDNVALTLQQQQAKRAASTA